MKATLIIAGIVLLGLLSLLNFWMFPGAKFVEDVPAAAAKVLASLLVITLFVERSLAAINSVLYAEQKAKAEGALRVLEVDVALELKTKEQVPGDAKASREALDAIAAKEEKNRAVLGFFFALLICAAGVRTLSALLEVESIVSPSQKFLAHLTDIVLTAGLISGGSDALAQLIQAVLKITKPPLKYR